MRMHLTNSRERLRKASAAAASTPASNTQAPNTQV